MTVQNFVRIVWSFCENGKKVEKWLFLGHFWLCFSHSSHTILIPLRMSDPLWVSYFPVSHTKNTEGVSLRSLKIKKLTKR